MLHKFILFSSHSTMMKPKPKPSCLTLIKHQTPGCLTLIKHQNSQNLVEFVWWICVTQSDDSVQNFLNGTTYNWAVHKCEIGQQAMDHRSRDLFECSQITLRTGRAERCSLRLLLSEWKGQDTSECSGPDDVVIVRWDRESEEWAVKRRVQC